MLRNLLLVMILPALAVTQQPAQPDFSGRWTVAQGQAPADAGWGSTITIGQTAGSLTVEYAFFTRGDMQPPIRFTFALDGSETKNTVMMGRGFQVERSKTAWDGQALVITTSHDYTDPATGKSASFEVRRRLSLEAPETLIVETTRGTAAATRARYQRTTGGV